MIGQQYEFHIFDDQMEPVACEVHRVVSKSAARARAGRLAKKYNGSVDIAHASSGEWNERYITTASPSEYHSTGFRFERLDS